LGSKKKSGGPTFYPAVLEGDLDLLLREEGRTDLLLSARFKGGGRDIKKTYLQTENCFLFSRKGVWPEKRKKKKKYQEGVKRLPSPSRSERGSLPYYSFLFSPRRGGEQQNGTNGERSGARRGEYALTSRAPLEKGFPDICRKKRREGGDHHHCKFANMKKMKEKRGRAAIIARREREKSPSIFEEWGEEGLEDGLRG